MTTRGPTPDEWKKMTKAQRTFYSIFMALIIIVLGSLLLVEILHVLNSH